MEQVYKLLKMKTTSSSNIKGYIYIYIFIVIEKEKITKF